MTIKVYAVGGSIRDELLGLQPKDLDYAVEAESWAEFKAWVESTHEKVFLEKPEFLTIRALKASGDVRDYVMCRKDGIYSDSRHPDSVEIGSIYEDLARRDFTANALAREFEVLPNGELNKSGRIIDLFGGATDIQNRILRCVGNPKHRFSEDPLRLLRAIRFMITKEMNLSWEIQDELNDKSWANKLKDISRDRVREELERCFKFNSLATMYELITKLHSNNLDALFCDDLWLIPTTKVRNKWSF